MLTGTTLTAAGIDAVALKPSEVDVSRASALDVDVVTVDYEGVEHLPDPDVLDALAGDREVRLTTPVRADGFDPLGDDSRLAALPESVGSVLVAGHPAYLSEAEASRPVAPRLREAAARTADPWVGTEGVERIAMAVGGTQFELLGPSAERDIEAVRSAGFEDQIAVYAPTVLTDDEDAILDAVGEYAARRKPVRDALPNDAATGANASGRAREVLSQAVRDYALVGDVETVAARVSRLEAAGADTVVAYPARGLDPVLS
ncbi:hypothetical protein SAMN05216559_2579 [Halomicrobium zhouii]|uniref:Luciferase-like monooxygenase n=1 Tax=Halomicrobium zhouii TaxID=767519 RepID=A0A1I6LEW4_9EURY|nr:luciferase [Halomicrobium zhouii]SFS01984.1 hypothetical protein SAMN05216559_2579 [Halomicrobium zhouii]